MKLEVQFNANFHRANDVIGAVAITPPLTDKYWSARVPLYADQAIVCFPKFFVIGCGFAQEEDWNTNLPLSCPAEAIYKHIKHNKKYECITDESCIEAIRMLQAAVLQEAK